VDQTAEQADSDQLASNYTVNLYVMDPSGIREILIETQLDLISAYYLQKNLNASIELLRKTKDSVAVSFTYIKDGELCSCGFINVVGIVHNIPVLKAQEIPDEVIDE